ncbi:MAG: bifunctional phosphoserine phosphatase/homoserine phosphotransferase ThrH [Spirochaetales bacterium]
MHAVCLDLEGVLFPEVWLALAEKSGIDELRLTTRDVADYTELMNRRIATLRQAGIGLSTIQRLIGELAPLSGARDFLDRLRETHQVFLVSDTFYEFLPSISRSLGYPTVFCNRLQVDADTITDVRLRQPHGKLRVVEALQSLQFPVAAAGDSHNDLEMIRGADAGALFRAPEPIRADNGDLPAFETFGDLETWIRTLSR